MSGCTVPPPTHPLETTRRHPRSLPRPPPLHHDHGRGRLGPRIDDHASTMTDRRWFVVAVIYCGPGQRPCRRICPCTHTLTPKPKSPMSTVAEA
ncbi:DUF6248 family natural product biosynthesis protein [Streptomyces sp. NPDC005209]|uniref:DUF6248 family natural product biosynthesis protein n=1 Tax=Streptomyces sp. NPDC005209 TaxID=3156715 RepID=UPI0033A2E877